MKKLTELREKALNAQIELALEMQSHGLNLICCCNCGNILIQRITPIADNIDEEEVICDSCLTTVLPNDCCDYLYENMSISDDFSDILNNEELLNSIDKLAEFPNETEIKQQQFNNGVKMIYIIYIKGLEFEYDSERDRNKDFNVLINIFEDKFKFV